LPFPLQSRLTGALRPTAIEKEKWEFLLVWGGQIAPLLPTGRLLILWMHSSPMQGAYFDMITPRREMILPICSLDAIS